MATYMCGCMRDSMTEEEIYESAYAKGRKSQGIINKN